MSKPPPCAPGRSCWEIAPAIRPRMRNAMKGGVGGEHVPDDGQDLVGDGDEGFLVSLLEADDDRVGPEGPSDPLLCHSCPCPLFHYSDM
jgi:hypothetical protein